MWRPMHALGGVMVATMLAAVMLAGATTVAAGRAAPPGTSLTGTHAFRRAPEATSAGRAAMRPATGRCGRGRPRTHAIAACLRGSSGGAARADYNGDGYTDLALGVPHEDVGSVADAGIVQVLFGSLNGFSPSNSIVIQAGGAYLPFGTPGSGDLLGFAVAGGDFDGNGYADLAIGVPGSNAAGTRAGAVDVIYGSPFGLGGGKSPQELTENRVGWSAQPYDWFGTSLVWGQFGKGSAADLVVGAPFAPWGSVSQAGLVFVMYGSPLGLILPGQLLERGTGALGGISDANQRPQPGDHWGQVLLARDFGGLYTEQELVVGDPDATVAGRRLGVVTVLYGTPDGLTPGNRPQIDAVSELRSPPDWTTDGQSFGAALAAWHVPCDLRTTFDLVIGAPGSSLYGPAGTGALMAAFRLAGSGRGLDTQLDQAIGSGFPVAARSGTALAGGDFDGDGASDLAIGAPRDSSAAAYGGSVEVIYGCIGFQIPRLVHYRQGTAVVGDAVEPYDNFGGRLSAWNFGNGPETDLAVGIPDEDIGSIGDAGEIDVLFGSASGLASHQLFLQNAFGLSIEPGDHFGWSLY